MHERNEIDRILFGQQPLLKNNLPIETLEGPPPPKGDLVFELKQLPDTLKYSLNNVHCLNTIFLLKLYEALLHLKVILCLN